MAQLLPRLPVSSRPAKLWRATLLATALLDEATIGFLVVALPLVRDAFHLSYEQVGLLFTVGSISSLIFEPVIALLSDRGSKRWPILLGMLACVAGFALAGLAAGYLLLLLAFVLLYPALGAAVTLSQAALVDVRPEAASQTLARWTLLSGVGDVLAPLLVSAALATGRDWRSLCLLAAAIWLAAAVVTGPQRFPATAAAPTDSEGDEPPAGTLAALRDALRDRLLLRWVVIVILATALDEIYLGFAALYLRDQLHLSISGVSLALFAFLAGGVISLVVLDRVVQRVRSERLLPGLMLIVLVGVGGLLLAPNGAWAAVALFVTGMAASAWYPIAKAAAYSTRPGRSGSVLAVVNLGQPFEIALPAVVGFLAGRFGLPAAIACLGLAPVAVLILAPRALAASRQTRAAP